MGMGIRSVMGMGMGWEWELRRGNGKKSPHTVTIANCAIHGNSWAVKLLATDFNGYCGPHPLTALLRTFTTRSVVGPDTETLWLAAQQRTSEVPCRCHLYQHQPMEYYIHIYIGLHDQPLRPSKTMLSGHNSAVSQLLCNSTCFSAVTSYWQRPCTDYCKIYLSRRESNRNKCECQGCRRRAALWLSRLVGHWHYKRLQAT